MAPMTKGSNLPYRRLCAELGARVLMSEMTVARRLKQRRRGEFVLIRRAPDEPFFGVQLAGTDPEEMGWAAALVESRGADLVDVNFGCPIDHFTRKGMGAALGRQPKRIGRIVEAMKRAVTAIPVTAKIRLGWNDARPQLPRPGPGRGRRRRRCPHRPRADARCALSPVGRLGRDWRSGCGGAGSGGRQRGHPVSAPHHRGAGPVGLRRRHGRPRRAHQAVAVQGGRRRLRGHHGGGPARHLPPLRRSSPASTGARTSTASRASASSSHGTSGSGAATRRAARTAAGPACRRASRPSSSRSPLEALLARGDEAAIAWLADRLVALDDVDPAAAPAPSAAPGGARRPRRAGGRLRKWDQVRISGAVRAVLLRDNGVFGDHAEGALHAS